MIKQCPSCGREYNYDIDDCLFCFSHLTQKMSGKFRVEGYTQVKVASKGHEDVPYFSVILKDPNEKLFLTKLKHEPTLGGAVDFQEKSKLDLLISVIGTGPMGRGIVELLLTKGLKAILLSRNQEKLNESYTYLEQQILKYHDQQATKKMMANLTMSLNFSDLSKADIIIESSKEDIEVKKQIFQKIREVSSKNTIIATNTSSLSVTALSKYVLEPSMFFGLHFFNPVIKMKLVEIVITKGANQSATNKIRNLVLFLDKEPILVPDTPGFVVNRALVPYLLEAIKLYEEGIPPEDIDTAIRLGLNYPLGPLALIDLIGLDVLSSIINNLFESTNDNKFKLPLTIKEMVENNKLGRKTGEGFYRYQNRDIKKR